MKFSEKLYVYFTLIFLVFIIMVCTSGKWKYGMEILLLMLLLIGTIYSICFFKALEEIVEVLPDVEKTDDFLKHCRFGILQNIGTKERQLQELIEKKYHVQMEDRQSKINSLQSQINPHFLYNTLESIRSEAICQGNQSIASMAKALASFFRYSISRKENIVSIQDELNNIQNYIRIQNYRFEDKFYFQVDIPEEDKKYLGCQIPKMTIQPIVENAIFHGLETKMGDADVTIKICTTQDKIILTVSDNGVGMSEKQLQKLQESLLKGDAYDTDNKQKSHGNGIALYNADQRLKLIFGEEYGIHVYSMEGEGTDVEIVLPIRAMAEKE